MKKILEKLLVSIGLTILKAGVLCLTEKTLKSKVQPISEDTVKELFK